MYSQRYYPICSVLMLTSLVVVVSPWLIWCSIGNERSDQPTRDSPSTISKPPAHHDFIARLTIKHQIHTPQLIYLHISSILEAYHPTTQ